MARKMKVLIVERQKQMIKYLKDFIPWDELGYEIVSVTQGQDRAMAYFGEYNHDVVITNLKLSDGAGISFIQFVKKVHPSSKVIVISDDESYAIVREAFLAGADDYLIRLQFKPVALIEILNRFKGDEDATVNLNWKIEMKNLLGGIRDHQNVNKEILSEAFKHSELGLIKQDYRMIYVRMDNVSYVNKGFPIYGSPGNNPISEFEDMFLLALRNRQNLEENISEICTKYFGGFENSCTLFTKNHSLIALIEEKGKEKFIESFDILKNDLEEKIGQKFSIVLSKMNRGCDSFLDDYNSLLQVHRDKFYEGDGVFLEEETRKKYNDVDLSKMKNHQIIIKCFKNDECDKLQSLFENTVKYFEEECISPDDAMSYFETLFKQMKSIAEYNDLEVTHLFDDFILGIQRCETSTMMTSELGRIARVIKEVIAQTQFSKSKRYAQTICQYINANMTSKISINELSNLLGLTGIHTSRVFKKEMNEDLSKYIARRKMEAAAVLLETSDYRIKEVAQKVGYEDQLYFDKVFKKYYGVTPKVYRKSNQKVN